MSIDRQTRRAARLARLKVRRRLWLDLHLWLGLVLGLFLAVIGLTGSILVFWQELDEWLNPALRVVEARPDGQAAFRPMDEITAAAEAALPSGAAFTFAYYPRNDRAAFQLFYAVPAGTSGPDQYQAFVNPYTAQVTGIRLVQRADDTWPRAFMPFVFQLHYSLLLGENGGVAVGIIAAISLISVLTGLVVWWPLGGHWRQALTIKRRASPERFTFDLHKTSGVYSALVLFAVLFSGIFMTLPQHVVPLVELFSPATYRYWFRSTPQADRAPIGVARALAIANARYPEGRPDWLYGAVETADTYTVCLNGVHAPGSLLHRRCVVMDRYTGEILDVDDPAVGTAGEVFTQWQWPLHSGQALGLPGRILVFLSGLACPVLYVTGVIRWLQKRRAARHKNLLANRIHSKNGGLENAD